MLLRRIEEVHRTEDVAVVGHRHSGLAQRVDVFDQLLYVACAVQQGVVSMQMKVGELGSHTSSLVPLAPLENEAETPTNQPHSLER
jgi:hypothetical protein